MDFVFLKSKSIFTSSSTLNSLGLCSHIVRSILLTIFSYSSFYKYLLYSSCLTSSPLYILEIYSNFFK